VIRRAWALQATAARAFDRRGAGLRIVAVLLLRRALVALGRALDRALGWAPRADAPIGGPVVIIGNPRSGTTFLHRFLVQHRVAVGLTVWDMLWPSRVLQLVLRPLRRLAARRAGTSGFSNVAHTTGPDHAEADDAAVMMHGCEGFFANALLQGWDPAHRGNIFRAVDPAARARAHAWWAQLWRFNLARTGGHRTVAKAFSISTDVPEFLARFPEAKLLYAVRDPVEQIASAMSLNTIVLDRGFGFWRLPEANRAAYLERLYASFVSQLRRFHADWASGRIDRARVMIVPYPRVVHDLGGLMEELLGFIDHVPDVALRRAIAAQAEVQKTRRSEHAYDLARFGLTAERVRRDCAFVYEAFLGGAPAASVDEPPSVANDQAPTTPWRARAGAGR
jgi:hypothetical protein